VNPNLFGWGHGLGVEPGWKVR